MESLHPEEPAVIEVSSTKDKTVRRNLLCKLRNAGNHKHNCGVLRRNEGTLVVAYRPTNNEVKADDYGPCPYCYGYYIRKDLWKHHCPIQPSQSASTGTDEFSGTKKPRLHGRRAHQSSLLKPPPAGVSEDLNQVLAAMKKDEVALLVKTNPFILDFAQRAYITNGHDVDQYGHIRNKLRELDPHKLKDIVTAVKDKAGFNDANHSYKTPSLAKKIGHNVKKCAMILVGNGLESGPGVSSKS